MTEAQRHFLVQARADFVVFRLLRRDAALPACHALHYLQMATEKLGKAHAWRNGPQPNTHRAFVGFLRSRTTNREAQTLLGYSGRNANWGHTLRKDATLAQRIEDLAPTLAGDGPNPEYPWPPGEPTHAPAEYEFAVWVELQGTSVGRQFVGNLLPGLFGAAHQFL